MFIWFLFTSQTSQKLAYLSSWIQNAFILGYFIFQPPMFCVCRYKLNTFIVDKNTISFERHYFTHSSVQTKSLCWASKLLFFHWLFSLSFSLGLSSKTIKWSPKYVFNHFSVSLTLFALKKWNHYYQLWYRCDCKQPETFLQLYYKSAKQICREPWPSRTLFRIKRKLLELIVNNSTIFYFLFTQ